VTVVVRRQDLEDWDENRTDICGNGPDQKGHTDPMPPVMLYSFDMASDDKIQNTVNICLLLIILFVLKL